MTQFPRDFIWGTATSSYQIEGGSGEDGRGESIWDRFAATAGKIADASDGSVACDHYHRWPADLALLRRLGVGAYRFSIAWPRILPEGRGRVNGPGLDFYDRLIDGLLALGIQPFPTLYHWDLPQRLEDEGGWPSRSVAEAFVEYADVVTRRLGDRVSRWFTHNEPWCVSMLGYARGEHAPGRRSMSDALAAAHHLLLSHGWAVPVVRANVPNAEVGIVLNLTPATPASSSEADLEAARDFDGNFNRWFLDPLFGRHYPADQWRRYRDSGALPPGDMPFLRPGDLGVIATPTDFLGVNYYTRAVTRSSAIPESANAPRTVTASSDVTDMGWEVHPEGLEKLLVRLRDEYAPPRLFITENGAAYPTGPDAEGRIRDVERQKYLQSHIAAMHRAMSQGVPVEGYFAWSLLDNFEWAEGYRKRFGLVWVDYGTQARLIKDSGLWFSSLAVTGRIPEVFPAH